VNVRDDEIRSVLVKIRGHRVKNTPVIPPKVNTTRNPSAKSIAGWNSILPPHKVASHENILIPVGTAMIIVMIMKGSCSQGAMPEVNIWCAQTMKPSSAIMIDENAIIL
jgi:hypothetical protein